MAGAGSRFSKAGFALPKPFIDVAGKPMIVRVMENLKLDNTRYILIARKEHLKSQQAFVKSIQEKYNVHFISIEGLTEGTACTVLYARHLINNDPLMIANSDQLVDFSPQDFVNDMFDRKLDGSILTFPDIHRDPKWSFAKVGMNNLVTQVKEKEAISDNATVGIYLFSQGKYFVEGAIDMILRQERVNNEYYTCPVYNQLINQNKRIGIYQIESSAMHGLGTPDDLNRYLNALGNHV